MHYSRQRLVCLCFIIFGFILVAFGITLGAILAYEHGPAMGLFSLIPICFGMLWILGSVFLTRRIELLEAKSFA